MRILLDECIGERLRLQFDGHDCQTIGYARLPPQQTAPCSPRLRLQDFHCRPLCTYQSARGSVTVNASRFAGAGYHRGRPGSTDRLKRAPGSPLPARCHPRAARGGRRSGFSLAHGAGTPDLATHEASSTVPPLVASVCIRPLDSLQEEALYAPRNRHLARSRHFPAGR